MMKGNNKKIIRDVNILELFSPQIIGFIIIITLVFIFFTVYTKDHSFARIQNFNNILADAVVPTVFAFGMGVIVAGGGFDLSLGHVASISALVTAYALAGGIGGIMLPPLVAILIGLATASIIGLISGLLVSRMGISSFIVTLGMQFLIIGVRQVITSGRSVYIGNKAYKSMASSPSGISNLILILILIGLVCYIFMEKMPFGRKIQFIGSNIEASRFKGINVKKYTMLTFIIGAAFAGFGGILFAARAGAVQINSVDSKLLDAITIAIFSSVLFGRFKTIGIILVAILISMTGNGMSMLGIKTEWISFMKGLILLLSIVMAKFLDFNKIIENHKRSK